ncbi:hypothetical protein STW0522ENT60_26610 [Enterobacter kobei]|uniref:hypothetical protein n=1 Tax=Enterobacter kobei TaxID=208224 RepID=UPI0018A43F4D|nr:hypothetical protein [Enterobacter kobei]BBV81983.1 hypothetical protein STW0522ENT60_26610 [Enterobacter kobei]
MITLTKEWLQKTIAELEEERDATPGAVNEDAANALAAMKLALASLEAEASWRNPVLAYADSYRDMANQGVESIPVWSVITDLERNIAPLFTAPPAPVSVPDDVLKGRLPDAEKAEFWFEHNGKILFEGVKFNNAVFDACRAAMLQGADRPQNEPQNIPENIPATQFKPVADLYGLTSPTGGETSFTFYAVEARDFIDGGWSCQEYVELGRYQEALTDHSEGDLDMVRPVMFIDGNLLPGDAEKLKAAIEEFNHSGEPTIMIAGNSPVIPDGWVMVPAEPTAEMLQSGISAHYERSQIQIHDRPAPGPMECAYMAMIAAAPQQEVK